MATLKQRLHRKNSSGSYDTVHLETSSDLVKRPDGTTVEAALTELKTSVSEGKALVAAAVTDKGVTTAADATFATMAGNISSIQTGVDINGIIKDYEVYAGDNISAGDFVNFVEEKVLTGGTERSVIDLSYQYCIDVSSTEYAMNGDWILLNDNTVIVVYYMYKNSSPYTYKLYSQTLTFTDDAITPHTPVLLQTTSKGFFSLKCVRINDTKFGILFNENTGNTNVGSSADEKYLYFKIYTPDSSTVSWSTTLGKVYNPMGMIIKEIVGYNNLPELLIICSSWNSATDNDTEYLKYYTIRNFTSNPTKSISKSLQIKCDFLNSRAYIEINSTLFGYLVFSHDDSDATDRWHLLLIDTTNGNVTITDKGKCYFDYNIWQSRIKATIKNGDKNQYTLLYSTADSREDIYQLVFKMSDTNNSIIQTQTSILLFSNTRAASGNMYFDSIKIYDSAYAECLITLQAYYNGSTNVVGTYGEFSGITYCSITFDDNGYITAIDKLDYILADFIMTMGSGHPKWKELNSILFYWDRKMGGYGNNIFIAGKIKSGEMITKYYCKSLTDDTISGVALESGSSGEIIKAISPNR